MKKIIGILILSFSLSVFSVVIVKGIIFNTNCKGYLKRAADANTVELAIKNLDIAIKYLEDNNLTTGYTSIVYKTPDEDIEFWYTNIKSAYNELKSISDDDSVLVSTNALMKLRETLIDNSGEHGDTVTIPPGIQRYPNNLLYGILIIIAFIGLSCFWLFFID